MAHLNYAAIYILESSWKMFLQTKLSHQINTYVTYSNKPSKYVCLSVE